VALDPDTEVAPLLGSKEGLVHLALSIIGRGDLTLLPQPAYPAHFRGTLLADGVPYALPQRPASGLFGAPFHDPVPDFGAIPARVLRRARLLILSYPTNPTASCAPTELFRQAIDVARRHRLVLVHDYAYAEMYFDSFRPPSLLALPGAKEVAVEFHSFSKTFSMAGWRIAFATGNAGILRTLMKFKSNCDYGVFQAAQQAGIAALGLDDGVLDGMRAAYRRRQELFTAGLNRLGWSLERPRATMYLWVPAPPGMDGAGFAKALLERSGVVVAPGAAFGAGGRGHVRFALVAPEDRLAEALRRMHAAGIVCAAGTDPGPRAAGPARRAARSR
jgi:LL-diaminopimelate aminotransferase